jgi:hypothetical protein
MFNICVFCGVFVFSVLPCVVVLQLEGYWTVEVAEGCWTVHLAFEVLQEQVEGCVQEEVEGYWALHLAFEVVQLRQWEAV